MNWFERQRLEWITEMLRVYTFINRGHLQRKFGISQPQASADLKTFQRVHPGAMRYDVSKKCYVAMESAQKQREPNSVGALTGS